MPKAFGYYSPSWTFMRNINKAILDLNDVDTVRSKVATDILQLIRSKVTTDILQLKRVLSIVILIKKLKH